MVSTYTRNYPVRINVLRKEGAGGVELVVVEAGVWDGWCVEWWMVVRVLIINHLCNRGLKSLFPLNCFYSYTPPLVGR